jgi:hypothetical protein
MCCSIPTLLKRGKFRVGRCPSGQRNRPRSDNFERHGLASIADVLAGKACKYGGRVGQALRVPPDQRNASGLQRVVLAGIGLPAVLARMRGIIEFDGRTQIS